jgi:hypothetical protein
MSSAAKARPVEAAVWGVDAVGTIDAVYTDERVADGKGPPG